VSGISSATFEAAVDALSPYMLKTLERAPKGNRFTTLQFIQALRQDPEAEAGYQRALETLAETPGWSHAAAQVLHGQVIPELLRACPGVRFAGFAHDAPDDGTMVPVYWRKE
jgi:hypothetical protein